MEEILDGSAAHADLFHEDQPYAERYLCNDDVRPSVYSCGTAGEAPRENWISSAWYFTATRLAAPILVKHPLIWFRDQCGHVRDHPDIDAGYQEACQEAGILRGMRK